MGARHRLLLALGCGWVVAIAVAGSATVQAQNGEARIWQGVYTSAQADRGKAVFNTACVRCHGADLSGTTAPVLKGDRFFTSWKGEPIDRLFLKIRDTMPPNFGTVLDDQSKLDIVTYILQTNDYPTGTSELALAGTDLASAQILRKGEQASVENFSLVQTVGCLARGPNDTWMLTRTAEPAATREDASTEQALAAAASKPLGTRTFRLLSAVPFNPQAHQGQKVEARGLVYNDPTDARLTLTSLQMVAAACGE